MVFSMAEKDISFISVWRRSIFAWLASSFIGLTTALRLLQLMKFFSLTTSDLISFAKVNRTAIGDLSPGQYRLDVVDNDGCKGSAEFDIKGDILVYNAISDNGDDLNAYMRIECIEDFPSSTVKIFNRAGILVWENLENGTRFQYQNQVGNQSFSGISNRIGTGALPEGTYFYIVEKGDDSDPIQGYLELVR